MTMIFKFYNKGGFLFQTNKVVLYYFDSNLARKKILQLQFVINNFFKVTV